MGAVVDAQHADVFVVQQDFEMCAVHRDGIELRRRGLSLRRPFQIDFQNSNRVIADIL
jgi:hypothetical protein